MVHSTQLTPIHCHLKLQLNSIQRSIPKSKSNFIGANHEIEVINPEENMGDVIGDLNRRRG
jgi:translation elongation factor EF-G